MRTLQFTFAAPSRRTNRIVNHLPLELETLRERLSVNRSLYVTTADISLRERYENATLN